MIFRTDRRSFLALSAGATAAPLSRSQAQAGPAGGRPLLAFGLITDLQYAGAEPVNNGMPSITFKSLLHQPDITAYAQIQLNPDRLVITGYGREKSREFPLRGAGETKR